MASNFVTELSKIFYYDLFVAFYKISADGYALAVIAVVVFFSALVLFGATVLIFSRFDSG